jgi:DNA-binding NtrC family response regulator
MEATDILFVDDDPAVVAMVKSFFSGHNGFRLTTARDGLEAIEQIRQHSFDVVVTDLRMPRCGGLEVLKTAKNQRPETEVVIVTGYASIESAIQALKMGGYDYLQKPIKLERLQLLITRIVEKQRLQVENSLIKKRLNEKFQRDRLVGTSRKMQHIYDIIEKISGKSPTVLIQGESGTGKELLANVIHQTSDRADKPFVAVNCGALAEGILESELFGHVKGSFTGAIRDYQGLFRAADGGTIFLDEIAEITPALQVKLLRVLQERRIKAVGDARETEVDVRVIAATNKNLEKAIANRAFRKDLYYRLNVVPIHMPPLREIRDDIALLVTHFIDRYNQKNRNQILRVAPEAMKVLVGYDWPGNVRELENVIERAYALGVQDVLTQADLPAEIKGTAADPEEPPASLLLKDHEIHLLRKALRICRGSKSDAARLLGVNITTVYRMAARYGITDVKQG